MWWTRCAPWRTILWCSTPGDAANRWPCLVFLRDGQYVTLVDGMLDWTDYVERVRQALAMPTSRTPGIGIAVVGAGSNNATSCH